MNKILIDYIIIISLLLLLGLESTYSQVYFSADPEDLILQEYEAIKNKTHITALHLRSTFSDSFKYQLKAWYKGEMFYNNGSPNMENMSDRWVGKGVGLFNSVNLSYQNDFLLLSVEPYQYYNQNMRYDEPDRPPIFTPLIDNNSHHTDSPINKIGIREFQLYLHRKGIGLGFSNANMWWGPGIHSSIIMTNNTSGFNTVTLGTIREIRIKNWELLTRYTFSRFDKRNLYEPYFAAVIMGATYYSNPIISMGLTKSVITGGTHERADEVKWYEAALSVFTGVVSAGDVETYKERWSIDDHVVTAFVSTYFPKSHLKIFLEIGRTDIAWDIYNLILAPDHSIAYNIGFRKYYIFKNDNLYIGLEYLNMLTNRYLYRLFVGPWYNRGQYEYSSFDGRYFGAHSGPDSDDLILYGGFIKDEFSVQLSVNYERHGLIAPYYENAQNYVKITNGNNDPELKLEYRLSVTYNYKGYKLNFNYERERFYNYEFKDKNKIGNVFWIGVEKELDLGKILPPQLR